MPTYNYEPTTPNPKSMFLALQQLNTIATRWSVRIFAEVIPLNLHTPSAYCVTLGRNGCSLTLQLPFPVPGHGTIRNEAPVLSLPGSLFDGSYWRYLPEHIPHCRYLNVNPRVREPGFCSQKDILRIWPSQELIHARPTCSPKRGKL